LEKFLGLKGLKVFKVFIV